MKVSELIEELTSLNSNADIRIEIGGALQAINHVYTDKYGRAFITDSLRPHGFPLERLDTIREEINDVEDEIDSMRSDLSRVSFKIERITSLLAKY